MRPYRGRHERPLSWSTGDACVSTAPDAWRWADRDTVRRDAAERVSQPNYTGRHEAR